MSPRRYCAVTWFVVNFAFAGQLSAQPLLAPPAQTPVVPLSPVFVAPPQPVANQPISSAPVPITPPAAAAPTAEILPVPEGAATTDTATTPAPNLGELLDEEAAWYAPAGWFGGRPWGTSLELGLNGSSGTSESLSIQAGGKVLRESRFSKLDLDTKYNRTTNGGESTQNNAELDVRNDWLLDDKSPWTLYATGNLFYDEFQSFDVQTSANTGVGYRFIHKPMLELIGRIGGGASREIGGNDDRWVPESLFGAEYTHSLSPMQKIAAKVDYYPEWEEIGEFRLLAEVSWETALVHPSNVSLKLAVSDRYDSTPGGGEPDLLNYSVLMLIKM